MTRTSTPLRAGELDAVVEDVLARTPFVDMHTHLFPPAFGNLGLWGIDELLTYHYLEAELFRVSSVPPKQYFALPKPAQADLIWRTLFVEQTPLSEATLGVVAVLHALGLDSASPTLAPLRDFFTNQNLAEHVSHVLQLAGISDIVMTNDPLDPDETAAWNNGREPDKRFHAALRIDRILNEFDTHHHHLAAQGYAVSVDAGGSSMAEIRRFLTAAATRLNALYMAVSLPDSFGFPRDDLRSRLLTGAVLPACRELRLPLALMIGVRRRVNPALHLAGDASGRADVGVVGRLCDHFPDNRFLVSVLSRENQHELCVYARKFSNLMPFGCWWFLNNGSIVEEITRERLEMLGTSFIPQHSDARVLEQLLYKWKNTRRTLAPILADRYKRLAEDGRPVTRDDVSRDVTRLFRGNFAGWTNRTFE
jgi:hypothetical protein